MLYGISQVVLAHAKGEEMGGGDWLLKLGKAILSHPPSAASSMEYVSSICSGGGLAKMDRLQIASLAVFVLSLTSASERHQPAKPLDPRQWSNRLFASLFTADEASREAGAGLCLRLVKYAEISFRFLLVSGCAREEDSSSMNGGNLSNNGGGNSRVNEALKLPPLAERQGGGDDGRSCWVAVIPSSLVHFLSWLEARCNAGNNRHLGFRV